MSQYSELIGSFIRTGNYSLEADYIFSSENELKAFYEIPENKVLLHKGWLKVVVNSEEQSFYWVTKNKNNDELEFTKLISSNNIEQIDNIIELINKEIEDRKLADDAIYGTSKHTSVPEEFNTLLKIANKFKEVALQKDVEKIQEQVIELQSLIDLFEEWKTIFLKGLEDYNTLEEIILKFIKENSLIPSNEDVVELSVEPSLKGTEIKAKLNLSNSDGNLLIKKLDGLYYNLKTDYEDGILTVRVNDYIISQHILGLSAIVESAKYDVDQEAIIIVFKLLSGEKQEVIIPAGNLIREWEVDNSNSSKVVELNKEEIFGSGADKLSADVRLYNNKYNILVKEGNSLYVKGTSDNIVHNDVKVSEVLDNIKKEKANVDSPIFTGVPMVETSPDPEDSSQRIPSTNWVRSLIIESIKDISTETVEEMWEEL